MTTPTTAELRDNIEAQLEAALSQAVAWLPKTFSRVLSTVMAGVYILLYKHIGFGVLQYFVSTASNEPTTINGRVLTPLVEWGRLVGAGDPLPAVQAQFPILVENLGVGTLSAGTQLINTTSGVGYVTLVDTIIPASGVTILDIRANSDETGGDGAGTQGNVPDGQPLEFVSPPAFVGPTAFKAADSASQSGVVVVGTQAETTAIYRQRIIDRFQKPPQGGALADYEIWGEEVAGIINVYPYRSDCPGEVDVYCEATAASSGSEAGIPTQAQLDAVAASIEFDVAGKASRRPVGALVNVYPISRRAFDVQVFGLTAPDMAATMAAIDNALDDFFITRAPYIIGLSVPPKLDEINVQAVGGVVQAIVAANAGTYNGVTITSQSVGVITYTLAAGEKSEIGAVSYA